MLHGKCLLPRVGSLLHTVRRDVPRLRIGMLPADAPALPDHVRVRGSMRTLYRISIFISNSVGVSSAVRHTVAWSDERGSSDTRAAGHRRTCDAG
jgi:hypothetical protein